MLDFAVEIIDLKRGIYFEHSSIGALHMGELGAMKALDFQRAPLAGNRLAAFICCFAVDHHMNGYAADTHMDLIGTIHAAARYVTPANFTRRNIARTRKQILKPPDRIAAHVI